MAVVVDVDATVQARDGLERPLAARLVVAGGDGHELARADAVRQAVDGVRLAPAQPERGRALPGLELERQHAHANEVGPVDPLERLGEHRADAQQCRSLRRPVARRAGAVLLPGDDQERHAFRRVAHGRVVQELLLAVRKMDGVRTFAALHEPVSQPDIAECAADHDLVVAPPRAVGVELERSDAVGLEPLACGRPWRNRSGRRDVVCGDRVAQDGEHAGALDVAGRGRPWTDALQERRPGDVRRRRVPHITVTGRNREGAPAVVAFKHDRVGALEQLRVDRVTDHLPDLRGRGPQVGEIHVPPVLARPEGLAGQVDVDAPRKRERDDEWRRGEV